MPQPCLVFYPLNYSRLDTALATSKLLLENSYYELRNSPINAKSLFDNKIREKNGKRKVQGVPQSQTAALPRHQREEEADKTKQVQIKQTYEKH